LWRQPFPVIFVFYPLRKSEVVKKWMLILLIIAGGIMAKAQNADTPAFKKNPSVPEIYLLQVDSSVLTKEKLAKQPTIIMFFSPTCDHCIHQWEDMVKFKDQLKNIQIVMATYEPFEEMQDFYEKRQIATFPNIKMGRDTKFALVPFYRMRNLPYQALYGADGKLITTFEGNVKIEKLLEAFNGK
jgi:thiol-disulfide isomerase/thioredoxin